MKFSPSLLALAVMAASHPALAVSPDSSDSTRLSQVTVSATRTERQLEDVASSVSVVTADDAEKSMARNIRDLVKYEPGVTVSNDSRFGNGSFNIRGMDENRVKISVDGVSQAKSFGYDRSLQSQRNFFDIENMKQLEVVKGPASSVHGSDAIGGVVAFVTKDPADYLKAHGDDSHGSIKGGYSSADSSFSETLTFANRTGDWESMLIYTRRDGNETQTYGGLGGKGETREKANPLDYSSDSVLGKLQYQIDDNNRIGFTGEWQNSRSKTDMLGEDGDTVENCIGPICHRRIYSDMSSDDKAERTRLGFFHEWDANNQLFDNMKWSLNWQESESKQKTWDNFVGCVPSIFGCAETNNDDRLKTYSYSEDSLQFDATFNKSFSFGNTENYLTYGVEVEEKKFRNDNKTLKFGKDGDPDEIEYGNWMPKVDLRQYSAFAQNEIGLIDDRLTITPSIRYDRFEEKIKSTENGDYLGDLSSFDDETYNSWTAGLGSVFEINHTWSAFAQYSQGFSTPDMFSKYFTYGVDGMVEVRANPDLKPEESDSYEIGLRANNHLGNMEVTAFYNDYKNFIEEACIADGGCSESNGIFQYQNLSEATIKGVEFKGMLWLDEAIGAPRGTRLNTAIAWAEGRGTKQDENQVKHRNEPLNTIAPLTAVFGLGYDAPSEKWGSELMLTLVSRKKSSDISNMNDVSMGGDQGDEKFAPSGYGLVDITAYYKPHKDITVNAGIFNALDKKYWIWDDVRNVTQSYAGINRYTQPGRNFSASIKWEFM